MFSSKSNLERLIYNFKVNSPDESVDVCSCYGAVPLAEGTNAVDKLAFANQLAIQPS